MGSWGLKYGRKKMARNQDGSKQCENKEGRIEWKGSLPCLRPLHVQSLFLRSVFWINMAKICAGCSRQRVEKMAEIKPLAREETRWCGHNSLPSVC
jgi:hypothetical protein